MSIIERILDGARNPLPKGSVSRRKKEKSNLTRDFIKGDMSLAEFRQKLKGLQVSEAAIDIPFPGILYGLLLKVGLDKKSAMQKTTEEKEHLVAAREAGLKSRIVIEFSEPNESTGVTDEFITGIVNVAVVYEIPGDIPEEIMRESMINITLAPPNPSPHDLASIPQHN